MARKTDLRKKPIGWKAIALGSYSLLAHLIGRSARLFYSFRVSRLSTNVFTTRVRFSLVEWWRLPARDRRKSFFWSFSDGPWVTPREMQSRRGCIFASRNVTFERHSRIMLESDDRSRAPIALKTESGRNSWGSRLLNSGLSSVRLIRRVGH